MRDKGLPAALAALALCMLAGCGHTALKTYPRPERFSNFLELSVGSPAPDFQLRDINGNAWRLEDQRGKIVVVQLASATSPSFVQNLDDFQREILARYLANPDVIFVYVFSIEAHPELLTHAERREMGENSYQYSLASARRYYYTLKFKDRGKYDVSGMIPAATNIALLVDTIDGAVGLTYGYGRGGATNPAFLIDADGKLAAKALNAADFLSPTGFLAGNLPLMLATRIK
jgi:hypothetical protein